MRWDDICFVCFGYLYCINVILSSIFSYVIYLLFVFLGEDDYNRNVQLLKDTKVKPVIDYFKHAWEPIKEQWVIGLKQSCNYNNNTTNRVESINQKLKQVLTSNIVIIIMNYFHDSIRKEKIIATIIAHLCRCLLVWTSQMMEILLFSKLPVVRHKPLLHHAHASMLQCTSCPAVMYSPSEKKGGWNTTLKIWLHHDGSLMFIGKVCMLFKTH